MDSINPPQKSLIAVLKTFRRPTWGKYLKILRMVSRSDGMTMNEISEALESKPQNIHPLLTKLMKREVLVRERRSRPSPKPLGPQVAQEFYYLLDKTVSLEEIDKLIKEIDSEGLVDQLKLDNTNDVKTLDLDLQTTDDITDMVNPQHDNQENNKQFSQRSMEWQEKLIQIRLTKLPDFNPEWSIETQKAWFQALETLSSIDK